MAEQNSEIILNTIRALMFKILLVNNNGAYRPVKGVTKQECYDTLANIQELLGTNIIEMREQHRKEILEKALNNVVDELFWQEELKKPSSSPLPFEQLLRNYTQERVNNEKNS